MIFDVVLAACCFAVMVLSWRLHLAEERIREIQKAHRFLDCGFSHWKDPARAWDDPASVWMPQKAHRLLNDEGRKPS